MEPTARATYTYDKANRMLTAGGVRYQYDAAGTMLLAFLATQHHNLHMLMMALGMGGAGMGFMAQFPLIRRLMLAISLIMTGVTVYRLWSRQRPVRMRLLGGISASFSLAMVAWSVYQFGISRGARTRQLAGGLPGALHG